MMRLTARYLALLIVATIAVVSLVILAETNLRTTLDFGIAAAVVLPMLVASRSCGIAWVEAQQKSAGGKAIFGYGLWFAAVGLLTLTAAVLALENLHQIVLLGDFDFGIYLRHPLTGLAVLGLALATGTLINGTGFALGSRAQTRLLPIK